MTWTFPNQNSLPALGYKKLYKYFGNRDAGWKNIRKWCIISKVKGTANITSNENLILATGRDKECI
jgi:hypothetical protein